MESKSTDRLVHYAESAPGIVHIFSPLHLDVNLSCPNLDLPVRIFNHVHIPTFFVLVSTRF